MRIRKRKTLILQNIMLIFMIVVPFSWFVMYGIESGSQYNEIVSFHDEWKYSKDEFNQTVDYTELAKMAAVYDEFYERYHLPLNYTVSCKYNSSSIDPDFVEVSQPWDYSISDNPALWTGEAMIAWVFHYLTVKDEGNVTETSYCLEVIQRMVNGMSLMIAVPNGGLGPEFPGVLARGWIPPENRSMKEEWFKYEGMTNLTNPDGNPDIDEYKQFNGTGPYKNYRWSGDTSNDEYAGWYCGMALALKYVDDPWVQNRVKLCVTQMANYMLQTNFLGIHGSGGPTGVDQKGIFGSGGNWIPLCLKMAAMADPETYAEIYYHWVISELSYLGVTEGNPGETLANYYAYDFGHCVILAYLCLEGTESLIGQHYLNGYLNSMRKYTENHRSAWFNAAFLLVTGAYNTQENEISNADSWHNFDTIETRTRWDIEDQLCRFKICHFPDRNYNTTIIPADEPKFTGVQDLIANLSESNWSDLWSVPFIEMELDAVVYERALTVEHFTAGSNIWQNNPFKHEDVYTSIYEGRWEQPGISFTIPYWMMRYMKLIPAEGELVAN